MRKDIPLHQYPKDVQIATHMIGLNYKRPYIRHGRRYYKPYRDYPAPTMRRCGRWRKRATS